MQKLLLFFVVTSAFLGTTSCEKQETNRLKKVVYLYHGNMKKKYGVSFVGGSNLTLENLNKVAFDYSHHGKKTIAEARFLVHRLAREFVEEVNQNSELRSNFSHFPIAVDDLEITVSFADKEGEKMIGKETISHVTLINGMIYYSRYDPQARIFRNVDAEEFISY